MTVPAPESLGPAQASGLFAAASSASQKAAEDKEMFLNLMVAQLRYQDPMNPADMGEFMAQNAQFQALEKMQEVADATRALMTQQMSFGAAGLVGREVTWTAEDGTLQRGPVGAVSFSPDGPVLDVLGHTVSINQVQAVGTPSPLGGSGAAPTSAAAPAAGGAQASTGPGTTDGAAAAAAEAAAAAADTSNDDTAPGSDRSLAAIVDEAPAAAGAGVIL